MSTNAEIFMQKFGDAIKQDKQSEAGFDEIAQNIQNEGLNQGIIQGQQQGMTQANANWQNAVSPNNLNKIKSQRKQGILNGFINQGGGVTQQ